MRSPRFDAALHDYGMVYAVSGWVAQGEIHVIAVRHSTCQQEYQDILDYLNSQGLPRVSTS